MKNKMKVAIVHDALIEYGGAEVVVDSLLRMYPDADVYTSFFDEQVFSTSPIKERVVQSLRSLQIVRWLGLINLWKLISYTYWESLDLSRYDIVITSSHSFDAKAVITGVHTFHLCYCHTSPKYLYPELAETSYPQWISPIKNILFSSRRNQDFLSAQRPDYIVVNSKEVQSRVKKYYRRNADIVYPPVHVSNTYSSTPIHDREYYLILSRLTKAKNIDLAIRVFSRLGKKLIVAGEGSQKSKLMKEAGETVTFLGKVSERRKMSLLKNARALIFPSIDEDFGITPVEAMGCGTPVIAYASGGVQETVIDGQTGVFYQENTHQSLESALIEFEKIKTISSQKCIRQARRFTVSEFEKKISKIIKKSTL